MKRIVKIPEDRIYAPIDFGAVLDKHESCGVMLEYTEYGFMLISDGKAVLFDAYSASHSYSALSGTFGVVGFPFYLGCMTDVGERVAYCGLRFGDEKAVKWELCYDSAAVELLSVDPDAASVPITSGVCCLASEKAYRAYKAHIKDEIHPLSGLIVLNGQTHAEIDLFGEKYAVFSAGWGDGSYKCYKGVAASGAITALIVDFGMIDYPPSEYAGRFVEMEVETKNAPYVYDPALSEPENNVIRWTRALDDEQDHTARMHAFSRRGYAYHSMNDYDAALSDYMLAVNECRFIDDKSELIRAWAVFDNAADIYIKRNDHSSAIKLMLLALTIGDNAYAGAYVRLIDLYQLEKRSDLAMDVARQMLRARPDDPVANMKYAEVCVSEMDYISAAKAYERLAEKFKLYENMFDQASCLIELGDFEGADEVLERYPSKEYSEEYWYYKAYIDYKRHSYAAAIEKAERSHELDREYMPALYLLIDIESVIQEYHAVARYAEEYKKIRPDNEYGYCVCAEAHMILGNYAECFNNYWYLFNRVRRDEKYAALAAITADRMGESKRRNSLLKFLKKNKKKSPYYYGALYVIYMNKYREQTGILSKVIYRIDADDDFLLLLAVFLTKTGNILPGERILDMLLKKENPPFELVAQQIRSADILGKEEVFRYFYEYYVHTYLDDKLSDEKTLRLEDRFRVAGAEKHKPALQRNSVEEIFLVKILDSAQQRLSVAYSNNAATAFETRGRVPYSHNVGVTEIAAAAGASISIAGQWESVEKEPDSQSEKEKADTPPEAEKTGAKKKSRSGSKSAAAAGDKPKRKSDAKGQGGAKKPSAESGASGVKKPGVKSGAAKPSAEKKQGSAGKKGAPASNNTKRKKSQ